MKHKHRNQIKNNDIALRILEEKIRQKDYEIDALKAQLRLLKVSEEISEDAKKSMEYGSKAFSKLKGE